MPEKDVIPILKNALDGLKLIHTLGYIHRDIKPENMIFQFVNFFLF
jgi:serine/threonine protein kinase